ncbi:Utp14-domain-containing protein [Tilletiaria anomala UBC 951]|uniref:Utp14-domain-containing protein n=1 Tax=Tilletiaria anomala (strain ATCC 24038 / CBS 436.72 / UBC 951) TaxID=1037660 RepID=A0A066VZ24_TILAU|nr:Utp14-domain-containing protein [Tilletiaria anomala UBC 951]KDN43775.1 Utp14-domain-containing protein [Tilletiaria anomala UBC 951]
MVREFSGSSARRGGGGGGKAYNAAQALARQQRKSSLSGKGPSSIHDVYDFATAEQEANGSLKGRGKVHRRAMASDGMADAAAPKRRSQKRRDGDDEEITSSEGDSDGDDDIQSRLPKVFDDDTGPAAPNFEEHDSDIDSDEAFVESDEDRFADWKFSGSSKKHLGKVYRKGKGYRKAEAEDTDEDGCEKEEDEGDEDEDDDMMDLSKMLDGAGSEEGGSSEEEDDGDESEDEGDEDDTLLAKMNEIATASKKRSSDNQVDSDAEDMHKRQRADHDDFFNFQEEATSGSRQRITVEDLLAPIADQKGMSAFRASARALAAAPSAAANGKEVKASRKNAGTLAAPLPSVVQDRLERSAAYEVTKSDVQGWQPTIKRLREAQHLSFPLQSKPEKKASTSALISSFKPGSAIPLERDSLEAQVAQLLQEGGMSEKQLKKDEELQLKQMDPAEVKRRQAELRRMRELMFRAEQKAKRVSKIKSKTYRKIHRKEKERMKEKMRELGMLPEGGEVDLEAGDDGDENGERLAAERRRALERATLKHKNQGKWAKAMLGRHELPADARQALQDQLSQGDELRKKIHGVGSDEDSDEYDYDGAGQAGSDSEDEDAIRDRAFDELATLEESGNAQDAADEAEMAGEGSSKKGKGLLGMKFMKDARERERQQARQMAEEFKRELEGAEDEGDREGAFRKASVIKLASNGGRAVYGNTQIKGQAGTSSIQAVQDGNKVIEDKAEGHAADGRTFESVLPSKSVSFAIGSSAAVDGTVNNKDVDGVTDEANANPWLSMLTGAGSVASSSSHSKLSKKRNEATVGKMSSAESKSANKLARHKSRGDDARLAELDDAALEIDPHAQLGVDSCLAGEEAKKVRKRKRGRKSGAAAASGAAAGGSGDEEGDDGSDSDSGYAAREVAVGGRNGSGARNAGALQQHELVAEAFAGDDVAAEFAAEKAALIEAEAPREEDVTLAGWGSWGGKGVRKSKSARDAAKKNTARRFVRHVPGLNPSQRKDAGMDNVIINQRRDKKAEKYRPADLPFPYTSAAQYELAMRTPVGAEWNTLTQHQKMTLPRVVSKPGRIIKPIERHF